MGRREKLVLRKYVCSAVTFSVLCPPHYGLLECLLGLGDSLHFLFPALSVCNRVRRRMRAVRRVLTNEVPGGQERFAVHQGAVFVVQRYLVVRVWAAPNTDTVAG